jgi:hypothetical protein
MENQRHCRFCNGINHDIRNCRNENRLEELNQLLVHRYTHTTINEYPSDIPFANNRYILRRLGAKYGLSRQFNYPEYRRNLHRIYTHITHERRTENNQASSPTTVAVSPNVVTPPSIQNVTNVQNFTNVDLENAVLTPTAPRRTPNNTRPYSVPPPPPPRLYSMDSTARLHDLLDLYRRNIREIEEEILIRQEEDEDDGYSVDSGPMSIDELETEGEDTPIIHSILITMKEPGFETYNHTECPVCLSHINEDFMVAMDCHHALCQICMCTCLKVRRDMSCPLCRKTITTVYVNNEVQSDFVLNF